MPVARGWRRKVATPPLGLYFTQVRSDEPDLDFVGWIFRNDALATAIVRSGEDVSRSLEVEGHDLCPALRYLGLALSVCGSRGERCGPLDITIEDVSNVAAFIKRLVNVFAENTARTQLDSKARN